MRAILFDLDGTLVQSEKLKAHSYAIAAQRLRGLDEPDPRAIEAYREIVGASRDAASRHVMEALDLEPELTPLMPEHGASRPEEVLSTLRTGIYNAMVEDSHIDLIQLRPIPAAMTPSTTSAARSLGAGDLPPSCATTASKPASCAARAAPSSRSGAIFSAMAAGVQAS